MTETIFTVLGHGKLSQFLTLYNSMARNRSSFSFAVDMVTCYFYQQQQLKQKPKIVYWKGLKLILKTYIKIKSSRWQVQINILRPGRTYICVSVNLVIIGSGNGLPLVWHRAIIRRNADLLSNWPRGTNWELESKEGYFFKKLLLTKSSVVRHFFYSGLNVLDEC